jgi:hypothetical protein
MTDKTRNIIQAELERAEHAVRACADRPEYAENREAYAAVAAAIRALLEPAPGLRPAREVARNFLRCWRMSTDEVFDDFILNTVTDAIEVDRAAVQDVKSLVSCIKSFVRDTMVHGCGAPMWVCDKLGCAGVLEFIAFIETARSPGLVPRQPDREISADDMGRIVDKWRAEFYTHPSFESLSRALLGAMKDAMVAVTVPGLVPVKDVARHTLLLQMGQACVDWVDDIGICHFCSYEKDGPSRRHDQDCLVAEYLALDAAAGTKDADDGSGCQACVDGVAHDSCEPYFEPAAGTKEGV